MDKTIDIMSFYKENPIPFLTDVLDVRKEYLWSKMIEIAESVRDNQFTAIKAGNSLSKSYTISRLALWFLYTHYPATVVTTAPSNTQVEEIIWREIASAHSNAKIPLGGKPLRTILDLQTWMGKQGKNGIKKWFATGFATKPDAASEQATRFQGFHNENVLLIFDEAAGILPPIWDAAYKLLTTPTQKLCVIGNPTLSKGSFVDCFKDPKFNKITVSVFDSPNYKAGRVVVPGLSGREFVDGVMHKYGKDSNYYKAMVTGEIPDEDVDSLIPLSWIEKAEQRKEIDQYFPFIKKFLVWDVADGGDDLNVIKVFENMQEIDSLEFRDKKVEEVEPYVWRTIKKHGANAVIVDGDGVGRVAIGLLKASNVNDSIKVIEFSGQSTGVKDPDTFKRRRSEGHWMMRDRFEQGTIIISRNPQQREELAHLKLDDPRGGFITVEDKKRYRKRLGRSPNHADAIMMACACFDEVPIKTKKKDKYNISRTPEYPFNPATC